MSRRIVGRGIGVKATMALDRDDDETEVSVEGTYYEATRDTRSTPGEGAYAEVEAVEDEDGNAVRLTDSEERQAMKLLAKAGAKAVREHFNEEHAEAVLERMRAR